ncbi:hypothetical protein MRX96_054867 [Rhipicephalus microplus]
MHAVHRFFPKCSTAVALREPRRHALGRLQIKDEGSRLQENGAQSGRPPPNELRVTDLRNLIRPLPSNATLTNPFSVDGASRGRISRSEKNARVQTRLSRAHVSGSTRGFFAAGGLKDEHNPSGRVSEPRGEPRRAELGAAVQRHSLRGAAQPKCASLGFAGFLSALMNRVLQIPVFGKRTHTARKSERRRVDASAATVASFPHPPFLRSTLIGAPFDLSSR